MIISLTKKRVASSLIAASLGAGLLVGSASADPQQYAGLAGVGSDTSQDLMNAFAGYSNGTDYTPIQTNASTNPAVRGDVQINSFDATRPGFVTNNCIVTKINGPAFLRPNGSGAGRRALAAANGIAPSGGQAGWKGTGCGTLVDITGQIDFARTSALITTTGTDVTFIPMTRDGVSFGFYKPGGTLPAVTSLTWAELNTVYAGTTRLVKGGVTIIPCGIQTSSGTHSFWRDAVGSDAAKELAATTQCNNTSIVALTNPTGRMQENEGPALKLRGDALNTAGTLAGSEFQVITGFSAAGFIAKRDGLGSPAPGPGIALGTITTDAATGGGTPGNPLTTAGLPNQLFYDNGVFGRTVYNVLPTAVAAAGGNAPLKQMFVDTDAGPANTAKICQATVTIAAYGFLPASDCGSIATTRAWEPANS